MVNEKILNFLKTETGYVSGEEISQALGTSRAAIWKHIQELRDLGYDIAAVPHLGYQLLSSPDRLFPWEVKYNLGNKLIARDVLYFEKLISTMDKAIEMARDKTAEGVLIIAEEQTKGKGRMGRTWLSPKHKGIYLSLILKPKITPQEAPVLTLITAVAVCEAIQQELGVDAQIKWPNDILLNNKKIGGILTELNAETDAVHSIVVGVGLNVNTDKKSLPDLATSLKAQTGSKIDRLNLLRRILVCFEKKYLQFKKQEIKNTLDKWRQLSATLGQRVKLTVAGNKSQLVGEAIDIDHNGSLLIRQDSGLTSRVVSGDIVHCKR